MFFKKLMSKVFTSFTIRNIKKKYQRLAHLPPALAEKSLERQVEMLMTKFPGRPLVWYYEKALFDLERDRR